MNEITLRSGCRIGDPLERLLRFCGEEYAYYDAIPSANPNRIEPIDVLAAVAMNSFVNTATAIRRVHQDLARNCDSLLDQIPEDADLLSFNPSLDQAQQLLHAAVQARGVLIPVATKVLHRKRRSLIAMLDNVVIAHYLSVSPERISWDKTQNEQTAAEVAVDVLKAFREDLRLAQAEIEHIRQRLEAESFRLTLVRILELLVWTEKEERGYYRQAGATGV